MFKRSRLLTGLMIATLLASPLTAYSAGLPDMGTTAGATLSIDQEKIYGDAYMRMLRASRPIIHDPVLTDYVDALGHRLVANANDVKTPFTFFLIQDKNINAFAFFGGYVALHSGLFLHAQSESELASVLAHEIAHVTQRHLARSMEDQARTSPATIAALAGSLLLAIAAPEAGIAALTATQAGSIQNQINYTRGNEKEADRFGIATLSRAGFDVDAMPRFFGRLADEYRYASKPPPMLLTHPLPEDRITDSRERARHYPHHTVAPSLDFHLARARVVARYSDMGMNTALDWFERAEKQAEPMLKAAYQYGQALIYLDNNQTEKAEPLLLTLNQHTPNNAFYLDALSDLYLNQQRPEKAQQLLEQALKVKPTNSVLLINYANVLIQQHKNNEALTILQRYTHDHPDDTSGWSLLSKANINLGHNDEDLAARAEIWALKAQWGKAIQYYTQASQVTELGSLKQARYDARIDQLLIQREQFQSLQ